MAVIAKTDHCRVLWRQWLEGVRAAIGHQRAHPSRTVVLVPYAQLMPLAQRYWAEWFGDGFSPRFETTRNWARQLQVFVPAGDDWSGDVARDMLTARSLLDRAGQTSQRDVLAGPLQDAVAQLAPVVAAIPPHKRSSWGEQARALLAPADANSVLHLEAIVARIALEWVLASRHATDVLFDSRVHAAVDALVVLQGLQPEPLAQALLEHWGDRAQVVALADSGPLQAVKGPVALHAASDAEDEAHRAAACVVSHLQQGRTPVALVANDRALTRRIQAHLAGCGVPVRDENGWTLSTTRAAAQVMVWLRAAAWDASANEVLDALKHAPALAQSDVDLLERRLRRTGVGAWLEVPVQAAGDLHREEPWAALVEKVQGWRDALQEVRALQAWLSAFREVLEGVGLWQRLQSDPAGLRVLAALRLQEGQQQELQDWQGALRRMALPEFSRWVQEVLEAARFIPDTAVDAPVVLLPLSQLLARPFSALVLPGCDEKRLPASPEPAGQWTSAQREAWGLPTRALLESGLRAAWAAALQAGPVDILWRTGDEGGEPLLASALVLALHGQSGVILGADFRLPRTVLPQPVLRPQPVGSSLPVQQLSSTAYADLRHCPYRFFALRQLGLQEAQELDTEVDKRDFGTWLHAVLQRFHEDRKAAPDTPGAAQDLQAGMDAAARTVTAEQGLGEGEFLPFAAGWPQVRDGYLHWLAKHEALGGRFVEAEVRRRQPLGDVTLVGTLDRIDALSGTGAVTRMVIDYKTESASVTAQRVKPEAEDTQLAFYAALLDDDTLRAAYVNVGERGDTVLYEQTDVVQARDGLVQGILHDMDRIAQGAPLPALGEGAVCDYCAARGLCRKDFWNA